MGNMWPFHSTGLFNTVQEVSTVETQISSKAEKAFYKQK